MVNLSVCVNVSNLGPMMMMMTCDKLSISIFVKREKKNRFTNFHSTSSDPYIISSSIGIFVVEHVKWCVIAIVSSVSHSIFEFLYLSFLTVDIKWKNVKSLLLKIP